MRSREEIIMNNINVLAELAEDAYNTSGWNGSANFSPIIGSNLNDTSTGLKANSYFDGSNNTLVIAFAGTDLPNINNPSLEDFGDNANLATGRLPEQAPQAVAYANQQIANAQNQFNSNINVVYTGHSLGGFLAQHVHLENGNGSAIVFNSPGTNSNTNINVNPDITYVFSNPSEWGATTPIHTLGNYLGNDYLFVMGAGGHGIGAINTALSSQNSITLTAPQLKNIIVRDLNNINPVTNNDFADLSVVIDNFAVRGLVGELLIEALEETGNDCFSGNTMIDVWPTGFEASGSSNGRTPISDETRSKKSIEEIEVGDWVVSFDKEGKIQPARVSRTFSKDVKIILDFFGTGVTPGHVYFRADSDKAHKFETLIDLLRDDGVIETAQGVYIRAATGLPIDDPRDGFVQAITGEILDDGAIAVRERGELRLGTRFITEGGRDYCIADLIEALGSKIDENGLICRDNGEAKPFHWDLSETLPKPEDYVLKRSGTSLEKIYQASEWEAQRPQMPPPMRRDGGPVGPLPASEISRVEPNTPLAASSERYARSQRPIFDARTDAGAKPVTSNKVH